MIPVLIACIDNRKYIWYAAAFVGLQCLAGTTGAGKPKIVVSNIARKTVEFFISPVEADPRLVALPVETAVVILLQRADNATVCCFSGIINAPVGGQPFVATEKSIDAKIIVPQIKIKGSIFIPGAGC